MSPFHAIVGRTQDNVVLGIGPYAPHQNQQLYADLRQFQTAFSHMDWITLELHPRDEKRILAALQIKGDGPMKNILLPNGEPLERRDYGRH